jgi:hypothetical protein
MRTTWLVMAVCAAWASPAGAECRASPNGAFSFEVRVSALAGGACLMDVAVFEGPDCREDERRWGDTRGCNETDRMAVTDAGQLVAILAPATAHRDWAIVTVLAWRDGRVAATRLALEDLPAAAGLRGVVRPVFDGAALRLSPEVLVPFAELEALAGLAPAD